jgi:hypothetical protein
MTSSADYCASTDYIAKILSYIIIFLFFFSTILAHFISAEIVIDDCDKFIQLIVD